LQRSPKRGLKRTKSRAGERETAGGTVEIMVVVAEDTVTETGTEGVTTEVVVAWTVTVRNTVSVPRQKAGYGQKYCKWTLAESWLRSEIL
jgi:hypothetical protein